MGRRGTRVGQPADWSNDARVRLRRYPAQLGETTRVRPSGGSELELGFLKEIGWGLRPQLAIDLARQVGDDRLAPFGRKRRDLLLQGSFSIYKRDWNVAGFAPSLTLTITRNRSTLSLYGEKRARAEIRLTKAF